MLVEVERSGVVLVDVERSGVVVIFSAGLVQIETSPQISHAKLSAQTKWHEEHMWREELKDRGALLNCLQASKRRMHERQAEK